MLHTVVHNKITLILKVDGILTKHYNMYIFRIYIYSVVTIQNTSWNTFQGGHTLQHWIGPCHSSALVAQLLNHITEMNRAPIISCTCTTSISPEQIEY